MARRIFFCWFIGGSKKVKGERKSSETAVSGRGIEVEAPSKFSEYGEVRSTSFSLPVPSAIPGGSRCKAKVMDHESPVGREIEEVAYEGEDEHDENLSMRRDNSNFDLQGHAGYPYEENDRPVGKEMNPYNTFDIDLNVQCETNIEEDADVGIKMAKNEHLIDPGTGKATFWGSPTLVRSCSDLVTSDMLNKMAAQLPPMKSESFEELQKLAEKLNKEVIPVNPGSPLSVRTHCSADKVILKKHSSSKILPSRSRKLWWKLFLWSHRNLHKERVFKPLPVLIKHALNQKGGYSSDTLEPRRIVEFSEMESPNSFTEDCLKNSIFDNDNQSWDGFHGVSGLWPQNQWVAIPGESSMMSRVDEWPQNQWVDFPGESSKMSRIDEWVKGLPLNPSLLVEKKDDETGALEAVRLDHYQEAHLTCFNIQL